MKNTIKWFGVIALTAVMVITAVSCSKSGGGSSGGGGKSLNSAEDLKAYLDKQPANSPDKPIKIAMKLNEPMFSKVRDVINEAGKYVSLDLTGSPTTTIPDEAFVKCQLLIGIIIPKGVTEIGDGAFYHCNSLASVTFQDASLSSWMIDNDWVHDRFPGDLADKYLAGGVGTYITTAPGDWGSEWTKQ